jgi:hypothetical protein
MILDGGEPTGSVATLREQGEMMDIIMVTAYTNIFL